MYVVLHFASKKSHLLLMIIHDAVVLTFDLDLVSRGSLGLQVFQVPLASQEQAYRARRQVL